MKGKISILNKNDVKVHTYTSPENGAMVNSHIIETKNNLVLIDTQFLRSYAKEVRDYADGLGKTLERIIITHSHPDHWFGLEYFGGIPVYSLAETRSEIETLGEIIIKNYQAIFKDAITARMIVPKNEVKAGTPVIDGLKYEFEKINSAEAGVQLLIKLPELAVLIAQDLAYNRVHLFIGQNCFDGWIKTLNELKMKKGYDSILVGHGENSDRNVFDQDIAYLKDAKTFFTLAKDGNELKNQLVQQYPEYRAMFLIDASNSFLYR